MPVLVYDDTTWNAEYLLEFSRELYAKAGWTYQTGDMFLCSAGGLKSSAHLLIDMYGAITINETSCRTM